MRTTAIIAVLGIGALRAGCPEDPVADDDSGDDDAADDDSGDDDAADDDSGDDDSDP